MSSLLERTNPELARRIAARRQPPPEPEPARVVRPAWLSRIAARDETGRAA